MVLFMDIKKIFFIILIFISAILIFSNIILALPLNDSMTTCIDFRNSLNDVSSAGRNCTINSGTVTRDSQGLLFDGNVNNVTCGTWANTDAKSIILFYNTTKNDWQNIFIVGYDASQRCIAMLINPSTATTNSQVTDCTTNNIYTNFIYNTLNRNMLYGITISGSNNGVTYINGSSYNASGGMLRNQQNTDIYLGRKGSGNYFAGRIYQVMLYDRQITNPEIEQLWSGGTPLTCNNLLSNTSNASNATITPTYNLTLLSVPLINTTTRSINVTLSVIANNTNLTGDYATIYYKLYTSLNNNCAIFYQNTCILNDNILNKNMTRINSTFFNTSFDEDDYIPSYFPFNISIIHDTGHNIDTIYKNNNILWNISNFSTQATQYNILFDADVVNQTTTTTPLSFYYCNNSYNGNTKPETDNNCVLANSMDVNVSYQKHNERKSKYQTIVLGINGINKTQQSYIIMRNSAVVSNLGWTSEYINGTTTYDNKSFKICSDIFICSPTSRIYDIHIHPFVSSDYFSIYAILYDNGSSNTSITIQQYLNLTPFKPTSPFVNSPCNIMITIDRKNNVSLFFNWTQSFSINNLTLYYNLTIYPNSNNSFIAGYLNTTFYNWSFINYTNGTYFPDIYVYDTIGQFNRRIGVNCQFEICENTWVKTLQPCINYVRIINYTDSNKCNMAYNIPSDEGTYETCTIPTNQDLLNIYNGILFIGVVILICAILIFFNKKNRQ